MKYKVEALERFKDTTINDYRKANEVFEVTEERKDVLLGKNDYNKAFVKVVEVVEEAAKEQTNVEKAVKGRKKAIKTNKVEE